MDTCMWLIHSKDAENKDYKQVRAICEWFHDNREDILVGQKNSYYPRMKNTKKRGFGAVKEIAELVAIHTNVPTAVGMVLNLIPLLKNHYTLCPDGIIVYNKDFVERLFEDHESIVIDDYNPLPVAPVDNDFLKLFKELLEIEGDNLTKDDAKTLIGYLLERL